MADLEAWSFLWKNPERYLIVTNLSIFPDGDIANIFDKIDRVYHVVENDDLVRLLIQRMRQAGVRCVESRNFRPEPSEATKLIENGLASGLSLEEINRKLKNLRS